MKTKNLQLMTEKNTNFVTTQMFLEAERLSMWCAYLTYRHCCGLCWDSACLTCQTLWHPSDSLRTHRQKKGGTEGKKNYVETTLKK